MSHSNRLVLLYSSIAIGRRRVGGRSMLPSSCHSRRRSAWIACCALLLCAALPTFAAPVTIWSSSAVPAQASVDDPNGVELGVRFHSDVAGTVTGIRFYKGTNNTGTHVAHLWTAGGALLAGATFAGETDAGWQEVGFSAPVTIA